MNRLILAITIASILSPSSAFAREPEIVSLAPAGKWISDWDNERCQLSRAFGSGDNQIVVYFARYEPGDWLELRAFGQPLRHAATVSEYLVDFGPEPNIRYVRAMNAMAVKTPVAFFGNLTLADPSPGAGPETARTAMAPAAEAVIATLTLGYIGDVDGTGPPRKLDKVPWRKPTRLYRLELGSMGPPMKAVRDCTDALIRSWGYDPAVGSRLSAYPAAVDTSQLWLTAYDYPDDELNKGGQGIVRYRLDVDAAGAVTGCHVQSRTTGNFPERTCDLLKKRARLTPARDETGAPVRWYFVGTVSYVMGG